MDTTTDQDLDRIAKLLNHAENTDSEGEAEVFMARAQALAIRHSVSLESMRQRTLKEQGTKVNVPTMERMTLGSQGNREGGALASLAVVISQVNDVQTTYTKSWIDLYGMSNDIEMVKRLFIIISVQMVAACRVYMESGEWRGKTDYHNARRSFYDGYIQRIGWRLGEARRMALREIDQQDAGSGTLVLVSKKKEVDDYWKDNNKGVKIVDHRLGGKSRVVMGDGHAHAQKARIFEQPELD